MLYNGLQLAQFNPNDWPGTVSSTADWGSFGLGIQAPYLLIAGQKTGSDSWQSSWSLPAGISLKGRSFSFSVYSSVGFTWSFRLRDRGGNFSGYLSREIPANQATRVNLPAGVFSGSLDLDGIEAVQMELLNVKAWSWMNIILDSVSLECVEEQAEEIEPVGDTALVRLSTSKVRQASNYVQYVVKISNTGVVPVDRPRVSYFAAHSSKLTAMVDYSLPTGVSVLVDSAGGSTRIDYLLPGNLGAGEQVEFHTRIYYKDWTERDFSADWSNQASMGVMQPNPLWTARSQSGHMLYGNDPMTGERISEMPIWYGPDGPVPLLPYTAGGADLLASGRFWLLASDPLTGKELEGLSSLGLRKLEGSMLQDLCLYLFVQKGQTALAKIQEVVSGFYTAWSASQKQAPFNTNQGIEPDASKSYEVQARCWPDLNAQQCQAEMASCLKGTYESGPEGVDGTLSYAEIQCLASRPGVRRIDEKQPMLPLNDFARTASRLDALQQGPGWSKAMAAQEPTSDWLQNTPYTGEGVLIGVYDTGIDWKHPTFNEVQPDGSKLPRKARLGEIHSVNASQLLSTMSVADSKINAGTPGHGTHVAGIAAGNGWGSEGYRWRGVAPKSHLYVKRTTEQQRVGHVANHSTVMSDVNGLYDKQTSDDDRAIADWRDGFDPSKADTLVKTVVEAAGNGAFSGGHGNQLGYHSLHSVAKNPIVVGNYSSRDGKRHYSSSMGPTWDGRIKPDLMAPGSQMQETFTEEKPLRVYIDYIKLYRQGDSQPYWEENFESEAALDIWKEQSGGKATIQTDAPRTQGGVLCWNATSGLIESYLIAGKFQVSFSIEDSDEMEVSLRADFPDGSRDTLPGRVTFVFDPNDLYGSSKNRNVIWGLNADGSYKSNRMPIAVGSLNKVWYLRFDFDANLPMMSSWPTWGTELYVGETGTSMAAPHVTGIVALMLQKYRQLTGLPLEKSPLYNSTSKAILIHTATDMASLDGDPLEENKDHTYAMNDGLIYPTRYHPGPDFATGWGKVNAEKALKYVDRSLFREVGVAHGEDLRWTIQVPPQMPQLRVTAAWDDAMAFAPTGSDDLQTLEATRLLYIDKKLVNDMDLALLSPSGRLYYPWRLDPLPVGPSTGTGQTWRQSGTEPIKPADVKPAYRHCPTVQDWDSRCFDRLNNVEVVDVDAPEPGTWTVVLRGARVVQGNMLGGLSQRVSLVSDLPLENEQRGNSHPYAPNQKVRFTYSLGDNLSTQVTFSASSCLGKGDIVRVYGGSGSLVGSYTGCELAGTTLAIVGSTMAVELESDSQDEGYGFAIDAMEGLPPSLLPLLWQGTLKSVQRK